MFLSGDFRLISPAGLLQSLCQEQRAVAISAWRGLSQASMLVSDGLVLEAHYDALAGAEAVYRLMAWDSGQFQVLPLEQLPAGESMDASWEELVLEAARRRDELEQALPPLPPAPTAQQLDSLLLACPAVSGIALVGYDGRLLGTAGMNSRLVATASALAAGLGAASRALSTVPGNHESETFPIRVSVYADDLPTLLLGDWGDATRLLATLAPGAPVEDAVHQLRLQVTMMISLPL